MKHSRDSRYGRDSAMSRRRGWAGAAFTVIELVVVIAVLAMLAALSLPALCKAKAPTKVAACRSNYRQWTVSVNLYASDYRTALPRFDNPDFGNNMSDVGSSFVTNLIPYGLTVPMWFCPVRPADRDNANQLGTQGYIGRPIITLDDLYAYLNRRYVGETLLFHSWWVPRRGTLGAGAPQGIFPARLTGYTNTSPSGFDWPTKTTDKVCSVVPFISDICYSGNGTRPTKNINDINPASAHFFNGVLDSVNLGFIDGRVATVMKAAIRARYPGDSGNTVWFY